MKEDPHSESHPYSPLKYPDTNSQTYIKWQNVDDSEFWEADYYPLNKQEWYAKLDGMNNGFWNGTRTNDPYFTKLENYRLMETISGQLSLTIPERKQAVACFDSLDLNKWGINKTHVAYAICCYVIEQNEQDRRRAHPLSMERSDELMEFPAILGMRDRDVFKTYGKVENHFRGMRLDEEGVYKRLRILIGEEKVSSHEKLGSDLGEGISFTQSVA